MEYITVRGGRKWISSRQWIARKIPGRIAREEKEDSSKETAMKLPLLQLATSILLTVPANSWPYHGTVGGGESTVLVGPVYGLSPVSLLPPKPDEVLGTVIRGPVTGTTFVEGSSSGPVTIVSPGTPTHAPQTTPSPTQTVVSGVPEDTVLIKGASAGAVTLVAPSDNSIANNAASAVAEAKKGGGAAASAAVAIENAEESSANAAPIKETIGVASANAVIGPSTGPIIIAGPTAPPLPIPVSTSEQPVAATVVETNSDFVSVASTAAANLSISDSVTSVERAEDEPSLATDRIESRKIEGSASSSSTVTTASGSSTASATARVNLISPASTIAVGPLSNVVVSPTKASSSAIVVSGPLGTVSTASVSPLDRIKTPLHPL
ncbi:flocculation protein FLO11 [Apis mellifera caucasica]|nr:flocculation protein FLO11 [Apis mellifera caucasica]KAG9432316.1 flocculation protein FLO11 [Apis mellifera carnica]